jgi:purine-binding chemotaxis protein CheW
MDESREHMQDEKNAVDPLADDKDNAGSDEFSSILEGLVAKLDEEMAQSSPSEVALKEMKASDSVSSGEFLSPPIDFDPLLPEPGGATGDVQASSFPMSSPFDTAADAVAEFSEADPLSTESTTSLLEIPFEPDVPPTLDEMPLFVEPWDENDAVTTEQSSVASESLDETGGVLSSLIANIDNELALSEHAAGAPALSQPLTNAVNDAAGADGEQHVIFTLDGAAYSFPIASVTEIGRPLDVTPLPNVPEWMAGVANLRGDIISVVDLRRFFGLGDDEAPRGGRMLVLRSKSEDIQTALMVDAVRGIRIFNDGLVQQVTAPVETTVTPYMRGVYEHDKGLVVLLDPEKLMLSPEMQQFEAAAVELSHRGWASAQPFDTRTKLTTAPE